MSLYHKNKTLCIITQQDTETQEIFTDRCNFITSQQINDNDDYNQIVTLSYVYINMKYLKCKYDSLTENKIKQMIKNCVYP